MLIFSGFRKQTIKQKCFGVGEAELVLCICKCIVHAICVTHSDVLGQSDEEDLRAEVASFLGTV